MSEKLPIHNGSIVTSTELPAGEPGSTAHALDEIRKALQGLGTSFSHAEEINSLAIPRAPKGQGRQ